MPAPHARTLDQPGPYYRCRFPNEYALANKISHPRNVYLRQDAFEAEVNGWLATVFAPARLHETIDRHDGWPARRRRHRRCRGGQELQHRAWHWAMTHRGADRSLPSGRQIANHLGRHERWGRIVKRAGMVSAHGPVPHLAQ
jgi:hypothetical protein